MNAPFSRQYDKATLDSIYRNEGQPHQEPEVRQQSAFGAWLQISLMGLCILGFLSLLALCVVQGGVK